MNATLSILSLYPSHMNVYGDRGNVLVLQRRAEWRGLRVRIHELHPGGRIPRNIDLIVGGGGQDRGQVDIQPDLLRHRSELAAMARDGMPMLMVCGLYQLFGHVLQVGDGTRMDGLGVFDMETRPRAYRSIGNVRADTANFGQLVGFENHAGATILGEDTAPLATVGVGQGNNGVDRTEGAIRWAVYGTYLHGPLLPRNPGFADHLIRNALERRIGTVDFPPLVHPAEEIVRSYRSGRR